MSLFYKLSHAAYNNTSVPNKEVMAPSILPVYTSFAAIGPFEDKPLWPTNGPSVNAHTKP